MDTPIMTFHGVNSHKGSHLKYQEVLSNGYGIQLSGTKTPALPLAHCATPGERSTFTSLS